MISQRNVELPPWYSQLSYAPQWPQVVRSLIGRRGAGVPARAALATQHVTVTTWNRLTTSGAIRS